MTSGHKRQITTAMLWYIWNGGCPMTRGGMQHVDLHAQHITLYLTSCWKPTETPGTITAEQFFSWKQFLAVDNHWNLQAILRKLECIRFIITDWCYISLTRHAEDALIIKNRLYGSLRYCTDWEFDTPLEKTTATLLLRLAHRVDWYQPETFIGCSETDIVGQSRMSCLTMMDYTRSALRLPTHASAARTVTL